MGALHLVGTLAGKEVKAAFRQRSVHVLGAIVAALLIAAGTIGAQRSKRLDAERSSYQTIVRQQWEAQPDRHPHRVAHFGSFAFRPSDGLAAFDFGVDSFVGTTLYQEAHRQNVANFGEAGHASSMLRLGQLSMAMVLQVIVPLLIVFLGFSSVSGEREGGTLSLLRAQGVGLRALVAGKLVGLIAVLGLVLLPATVAAGALIGAAGADIRHSEVAMRVILLGLAYLLYFASWAGIVVAISARARTSRGALAACVALWIGTVIVLPRAAAGVAGMVHPAPARIEADAAVAAEIRETGDSHNPNDPEFAALKRELLSRHGVDRVEALPVNFGGVVMKTAEEISSRIYVRHFEGLVAIHRRQDDLVQWAALLSPVIAIRNLSMALAGTGPEDYLSFLRDAEKHRYELIQALNDLHTHRIRNDNDRGQRVSRRHWKEIPPFQARPTPLGASVRQQAGAAGLLLAWVLVVGMLIIFPSRAEPAA